MITVLVYVVSWQTICFKKVHAILPLSPINLLLVGSADLTCQPEQTIF